MSWVRVPPEAAALSTNGRSLYCVKSKYIRYTIDAVPYVTHCNGLLVVHTYSRYRDNYIHYISYINRNKFLHNIHIHNAILIQYCHNNYGMSMVYRAFCLECRVSWVRVPPEAAHFFGKVTALGVLRCFALFVCLTLLASFFLPSHLSFKNMYIHVTAYMHPRQLIFPRKSDCLRCAVLLALLFV